MTKLTFEELYERFIIQTYGKKFFKYSLYLNLSLILFIISVLTAFYSEQYRSKKINNNGVRTTN